MKRCLYLTIAAVSLVALITVMALDAKAEDSSSPHVTNLKLQSLSTRGEGHLLALLIRETAITGDLNDDGDLKDQVTYAYDMKRDKSYNLKLAGVALHIDPKTHKMAVLVSEKNQGGIDLDGDGDANDFVMHITEIPKNH